MEPVAGQSHILWTFRNVQTGQYASHFIGVPRLDASAVSFLVEKFKTSMAEAENHAIPVSVTYHYSSAKPRAK